MPTVASIRPITALIKPLVTSLEDRLVTMLKPKMASEKYSGDVKDSATLESSGAVHSSITALNRPPKVEAKVETPSARAASPRWVSG